MKSILIPALLWLVAVGSVRVQAQTQRDREKVIDVIERVVTGKNSLAAYMSKSDNAEGVNCSGNIFPLKNEAMFKREIYNNPDAEARLDDSRRWRMVVSATSAAVYCKSSLTDKRKNETQMFVNSIFLEKDSDTKEWLITTWQQTEWKPIIQNERKEFR